jgi:hypothetical protein
MAVRMVKAIPTTNTSLAGFAMYPSWLQYPWYQYPS